MTDLVTSVDTQRAQDNLSSALRLFVLAHYQKRAASGLVVDNCARAAEYLPTYKQLKDTRSLL